MAKKDDTGLQGADNARNSDAQKNQKAEGVWERKTTDRRWGQNQLFGSFRINSGVQALSQGDPTDNALAAIASILERPAGRPIGKSGEGKPSDTKPSDNKPSDSKPADNTPEDSQHDESVEAAVNSEHINSEMPRAPEIALPAANSAADPKPELVRAEEIVPPPLPPEPPAPVDEYVKFGPGPLDAIRFKWMARPAGDGRYFVDETIGNSSRTMTSGPMPKDEAIRFIDEREHDARRRFDALKNEMIGRHDGSEA